MIRLVHAHQKPPPKWRPNFDDDVNLDFPTWHGMSIATAENTDKSVFELTPEYDVLQSLQNVVETVKKATSNNRRLFPMLPGNLGASACLMTSNIGASIVALLRTDLGVVKDTIPGGVFNPFFTAFTGAMEARPRLAELIGFWPRLATEELVELLAQLNGFVDDLRTKVKHPKFAQILHRLSKKCRSNTHSSLAYLERLYEVRGTTHAVLRIDPSLPPNGSSLAGAPMSISPQDARNYLAKLIRYLRREFYLTGYIWSLEYGLYRGYHFHVLIFLNGDKHQACVSLVRQIGEHWKKHITEGAGDYFNCNAERYWEKGLGVIHVNNHQKMHVLRTIVIPYLTKTDYWCSRSDGRWFGKGFMPPDVRKGPGGRPRGAATQPLSLDCLEADAELGVDLEPS